MYSTSFKSIFDTPADAYVNTINCIGVMGAGIALEFKNRYPKMFEHYREQCRKHAIKPGDCYSYYDDEHHVWLLGLAVKDDWRHWSTLEWVESSIKSLKLTILENDIKWIASCLGADRAYATGWITIFVPTKDKMEMALKAWNEMLDEIFDTGACPYWSGLLWEERAVKKADKTFLDTYWKIKKALDPENIFAPEVFKGGD